MEKSLLIIPIISENPKLFEQLLISNNTFQRFKIIFSISTSNRYIEMYKTLSNNNTHKCIVFNETSKSKIFHQTINIFKKEQKLNHYEYIISVKNFNRTHIALFYNVLEKIQDSYLQLVYPKSYNKLENTNKQIYSKSCSNIFIVKKAFLQFLGSNPYNRLKTYLNIILKANCIKKQLLTFSIN